MWLHSSRRVSIVVLGCLLISDSFALTEGVILQPKDYIFYTFAVCAIAFATLIIFAYKEYKWLHYVVFSFLLILNAAAMDGSIAYLARAGDFFLEYDFALWVLPFLLTTCAASYGFLVIALSLESPHGLVKLKPLFLSLSVLTAVFTLSTFIWLERIALPLMWLPANVLFFVMIVCQILPPLTWPSYSPSLRLFIRLYPVFTALFAIGGYWIYSLAEDVNQNDFNTLHRWVLMLVAFFSLTIVLWQAFNNTRMKEIADRKVIEAARNEAEMQLKILKADQAYTEALSAAAKHRNQLATVSHDLKQPISALRITVDQLRKYESSDADKLTRAIDYIDSLSYSYMTHEQAVDNVSDSPRLESVSTHMFIDTLGQMFIEEAVQKNIQIKFIGSQHSVFVEPLILMRIMTNLIGNALKHAAANRILVGFRGRDDKVVFQVHDDGHGISEEGKLHLFVPGVKGVESDGHGLGLGIVQELCHAQGFTFKLDSNEGVGTSAYVIIPRA